MASSLWLLPTVSLATDGEDAVFFDGRKQLRIRGMARVVGRLADWLDGDHDDQLLTLPLGRQLVALLDQHGWIVRLARRLTCSTGDQPVRTRQLSYFAHITPAAPDDAFDELASRRVLVIGTGGIGSHVAFHLAASGVRHLVLNDLDVVEASNLNRQSLFRTVDIGRPKVDVVAEALRARFDGLHLETWPIGLDRDGLRAIVDTVDLVLVCGEHSAPLDHPEIIGDHAIITAGYLGCEGFVGPVVSPAVGTPRWDQVVRPGERASLAALESAMLPLANHWNSSGATINAMGGALLGEAAVRLLAPSLGGPILLMTRRFIDMKTLTIRDEDMLLELARPWRTEGEHP